MRVGGWNTTGTARRRQSTGRARRRQSTPYCARRARRRQGGQRGQRGGSARRTVQSSGGGRARHTVQGGRARGGQRGGRARRTLQGGGGQSTPYAARRRQPIRSASEEGVHSAQEEAEHAVRRRAQEEGVPTPACSLVIDPIAVGGRSPLCRRAAPLPAQGRRRTTQGARRHRSGTSRGTMMRNPCSCEHTHTPPGHSVHSAHSRQASVFLLSTIRYVLPASWSRTHAPPLVAFFPARCSR